jgi:hypothetical protein
VKIGITCFRERNIDVAKTKYGCHAFDCWQVRYIGNLMICVVDNLMRLIRELTNRLTRKGVAEWLRSTLGTQAAATRRWRKVFDFVAARHVQGYTRVIT